MGNSDLCPFRSTGDGLDFDWYLWLGWCGRTGSFCCYLQGDSVRTEPHWCSGIAQCRVGIRTINPQSWLDHRITQGARLPLRGSGPEGPTLHPIPGLSCWILCEARASFVIICPSTFIGIKGAISTVCHCHQATSGH